jgi:hypothetical protein
MEFRVYGMRRRFGGIALVEFREKVAPLFWCERDLADRVKHG